MMKSRDIYKFPSSFGQKQLWLAHELSPENSLYNIYFGARLLGPLHRYALEQAICEICRRHEILRTTFDHSEGELFQFVWPHQTMTMKIINLRDMSQEEKHAKFLDYTQQHAYKAFDLKNGPLIRTSLLILDQQDHILMTTIHHTIFDEWSLGIFQKELSTLYNAFSEGNASLLPEIPIQYADYTIHQKKYLQSSLFQKDLEYWTSQLGKTEFLLDLPTDRRHPPKPTYQGKTKSFEIAKDLQDRLLNIAQETGTTPFMLFLAAYKVLLYRYTQQDDILVGTPITMRDNPEVQDLIGLFLNTIVLSSKITTEQTFTDILVHVRQTTLKAYNHRHLPFERLIQEIQPDRSTSQHPLFQVMFVYNHETEEVAFNALQTQSISIPNQTSKFDITLFLTQSVQGLRGAIEYSTDLFEALTIQRMIGHFKILLEAIAENPQRTIAELPILTKAERHQLLVEWNYT